MTLDGPQPLTGYRLRDYDDLIARLAASRESQGIPMRELTRRCAVGIGTISEALRGAIDPSASRLVALADALGYDLALIPRADTSQHQPHCDGCGGPCRDENDYPPLQETYPGSGIYE